MMMRRDPNLVTPDVFRDSPNRSEPHNTQAAIEVISNAVGKIPEMGVKFEGDQVQLVTNTTARLQDHGQVMIEFEQLMNDVIKILLDDLRDAGYSSAKLTKEVIDVTPGTWRYAGSGLVNRQLVYTILGVYRLSV